MSTKIIPVSDLRRNVSKTIKELQDDDEAVYITQHGRPRAVLVSYEYYEQLLRKTAAQTTPVIDPEIIRDHPDMIALVDQIKAIPPNPNNIHPGHRFAGRLAAKCPSGPGL